MTALRKLQVLQNMALRIVLKLPSRSNTDHAHQKLNIMRLNTRRKLHITQLAQWLAGHDRYRDKRCLSTRSHAEGRRNIKIMKPNKNVFQKSFIYKAAENWNSLSREAHLLKADESNRDKLKMLILQTMG